MLIVSMSLGCVKRSGDATAMASCNFVLGVFAVLSIFINCAGMAPALTETFPLYGIAQKVMVKNFSGFWFNQVLFGAIGGANLIASNSSGGAIPDFGTGIDFSNAAGRAVMYGVILGGLYGPMMLFNADGLMDLYGGLFKDTQGNEAMTWAKLTMLNWGLLLVQNSLMGIAVYIYMDPYVMLWIPDVTPAVHPAVIPSLGTPPATPSSPTPSTAPCTCGMVRPSPWRPRSACTTCPPMPATPT